MSAAPEMAVWSPEDGMEPAGPYTPCEGPAEYVRVDRLAAAEAQLAECEDLLRRLLEDDRSRFGDNSIYPDLLRWHERRRAAFTNTEAGK